MSLVIANAFQNTSGGRVVVAAGVNGSPFVLTDAGNLYGLDPSTTGGSASAYRYRLISLQYVGGQVVWSIGSAQIAFASLT